jgi:hypothetical protein
LRNRGLGPAHDGIAASHLPAAFMALILAFGMPVFSVGLL